MPNKEKVFIVHGRDEKVLKDTKKIIKKFGMEPIVLRERSGGSQTIIEKIEQETDVKYAIVLLTPDDRGRLQRLRKLNPRARQNVIFELGYLFAKLGRKNVLCLIKRNIEKPSDIEGINYYFFNRSVCEVEDKIINEFAPSILQNSSLIKKDTPISILEFNFQPQYIKANKWGIAREDNFQFQSVTDAQFGAVLSIATDDLRNCYMQRKTNSIEKNSKAVEFIIKITNIDNTDNYRLYCGINVYRDSPQQTKEVWLTIKPGVGNAQPVMYANPPIEWIVYVPYTNLKDNWIRIFVDIPKYTQETFGRDGWIFKELDAIRLRGTMTIARIGLY